MQIFAKKKKRRGFTLIELLVVIAIIGILASIVLVSLSSAKTRAKDGRIIASMSQIRTSAEIVSQNDGDFDNVCCGVSPCSGDINTLCTDIGAQGGKKPSDGTTAGLDIVPSAASDATAYCAEVLLSSGKYYCVDSTLVAKQYDTNPACAAATPPFTCD